MTIYFENIDDDYSSTSAPFGIIKMAARRGVYRNFLKRLVDITILLFALPVVLAIVAILAVITALDGGSPFYTSRRVGKNGVEFGMLKMRTMVHNADALLESHLASDPAARNEWNRTQKLKNDPRITPIGKILRKLSLDELPQLWNVLVGDMSLVGPRPMLPEQRGMYPGLAYYALRPGITGPWQVSERNQSEFSKRAEYDKSYDEKVTFSSDMQLLASTIGVVIHGTGY